MCLISKHGWGSRKNILCDQVLTDDHDNHACRSNVLLNTAIDNTIFAYIHRLRQEAGGYICYQSLTFCVWKFFEFCAVNGVVLTDVYIEMCIRDSFCLYAAVLRMERCADLFPVFFDIYGDTLCRSAIWFWDSSVLIVVRCADLVPVFFDIYGATLGRSGPCILRYL